MPTIEASRLTKVYRTYRKERGLWGSVKGLLRRRYDETRAADQVSFQIEEGEFVGFLGPNGAGKTTVLKMLSGLLNPTSGDARVLGFVPWERRNEMKRQFSLLMGQKNALWWDLPAQESLELNRAIYGIDRERFKKVVDGLSDLLEVRDKMNVMVRELSFGEITEQTPVSVQLKVPRAKVTETCRQLLEACDVSDINVQEVPVEDVIRQLFGERHEEHAANVVAAETAHVG